MNLPTGRLSRRTFLLGGAGTVGLVAIGASCSDDGGGDAEDADASADADTLNLLSVFNAQGPYLVTGGEQRMAYALADFEGVPVAGPDTIAFRLEPEGGGEPIAIEASRHGEGIPTPYYPIRAELPAAGLWTAAAEVEGQSLEASFSVAEPGATPLVQRGAPAPATATPTTADPRGVDPICTAEPPCALHEVTLADALGAGAPVALLVATPAFCGTAVCGPVLDVVLGVQESNPEVRYLHAEVYEDAVAVENLDQATPAAITGDLGLSFEPSLFLIGADGIVVDRLDNIFDVAEVQQAVQQLTS